MKNNSTPLQGLKKYQTLSLSKINPPHILMSPVPDLSCLTLLSHFYFACIVFQVFYFSDKTPSHFLKQCSTQKCPPLKQILVHLSLHSCFQTIAAKDPVWKVEGELCKALKCLLYQAHNAWPLYHVVCEESNKSKCSFHCAVMFSEWSLRVSNMLFVLWEWFFINPHRCQVVHMCHRPVCLCTLAFDICVLVMVLARNGNS